MVKRWTEYSERLMIVKNQQTIVMCIEMKEEDVRMYEQNDLKRENVVRVIRNLKYGEASGVDGITYEILKDGGETG